MDVRITPLANFSLANKCRPGYSFTRNRSTAANQNQPGQAFQRPTKTKKSFLLLPSPTVHKPRAALKIASQNIQPAMNTRNKNAMMLYQQIERNKLFSGGAELMNRFNYKV